MKMDVQQLSALVDGKVFPPGANALVTGVSTDSRTLREGDLFVPLRGPSYDGHDYLLQAVQHGASACFSEEMVACLPVPVIGVDNTLVALGQLAAGVRSDFSGPVVGITGSSGKTTTKEMLASILSIENEGVATVGNFNNLIGLPLTILRLEDKHRWMVLEMGMSARGEIARLAEIAQADVGVVTNVGAAHLEQLHGLDGVARAKGELFIALKSGATAVINADDERVSRLPVANGVRRLLFGCGAEAQVRALDIAAYGLQVGFRLVLPGGAWPVRLSVPGRHNVHNALAAAAAAWALGVAGETIVRGLDRFVSAKGRMEVVSLPGDRLLIEDSYNANPLSMKAALEVLAEMGAGGERVAVLGDMLELGDASPTLHHRVGQLAAVCVDRLFLLGAMAREVEAGALDAGLSADRIRILHNHEEGITLLRASLKQGARILVKGSRGMKMETISNALRLSEGINKEQKG